MKRFWFVLKLVFACIGAGTLILFAALIYGLSHFKPASVPQSHEVSRPIQQPSQPIQQPIQQPIRQPSPPIQQPSFTPPKPSTPKGFVESEAEKEFERKNGVEIVHRKDGTTYTRKATSKKAK